VRCNGRSRLSYNIVTLPLSGCYAENVTYSSESDIGEVDFALVPTISH